MPRLACTVRLGCANFRACWLLKIYKKCIQALTSSIAANCIWANGIFPISLEAFHVYPQPEWNYCHWSVIKRQHHITLTHHPFHNLPKVISGLGHRSQLVQMKRPSMKRGDHFPEKPNWLLQTSGMTKMKLAHLNPLLGGRGNGKMRGGGKHDRDWQRETQEDKWDHEREKRDECGCRCGFRARGKEYRDDRRGRGDII